MICPVCQSSNLDEWYKGAVRARDGHIWSIVYRCLQCEAHLLEPEHCEPTTIYEDGTYENEIQASREPPAYYARLLAQMEPSKSLLDVGPGRGDFAKMVVPWFDNIHTTTDIRTNLLRYQTITLWTVLEHVHDPRPFMAEVVKRLDLDGQLYITVPNINNTRMKDNDYRAWFWRAHHPVNYTLRTLDTLLGLFGLKRFRYFYIQNYEPITHGKLYKSDPFQSVLATGLEAQGTADILGAVYT